MGIEAAVEGLWGLADEAESSGDVARAVKCLEAVVQSGASLLPATEIRTRLRISSLLLDRSHNISHAKSHLERSLLLLQPSAAASDLDLKLRAHSLLARCNHLAGSISSEKQLLLRALHLLRPSPGGAAPLARSSALLWSCNLHSQLASAAAVDADYPAALAYLDAGASAADELRSAELQAFFAASILNVHLLHWDDSSAVESALLRCTETWGSLPEERRRMCRGLFFFVEVLHAFYLLRVCDYKAASLHVDKLDTAMKEDVQRTEVAREMRAELDAVDRSLSEGDLQRREIKALQQKQSELRERLGSLAVELDSSSEGQLPLAPPPLDGEWLPKAAVYALVDLMVVMVGRPKGVFKECGRRIQSGIQMIHEELVKLGIHDGVKEVGLRHSAIWMAGLYLVLLMHFLENKVAVELTRSEFVDAQEALVQMMDWFARFPTILQGCESTIEMLRGQYAHSVGCFNEAAFHFLEATKMTDSKSMKSMCQVYAAVSYICVGDPESTSLALDLVGPVYKIMDSFVGVRERTCVIFAYGLLLMRQHNPQEARIRLASGLKVAHQQLGNIQLVSQYLTILGTLALQLHDTGQAKEILKSSLTLAKTLYDVPTQIWVLSVLTALYRELGERSNEMENSEYERKKEDDLQKRLSEAYSSSRHLELVNKSRIEVQQLHGVDIRRAAAEPSKNVDLEIPESVGLPLPLPQSSPASRFLSMETRRGKKKI